MPRMHHRVTRSADDRTYLTRRIGRGRSSAFAQRRARVLLKTDRPRHPRLTDAQVADAGEGSSRLVARYSTHRSPVIVPKIDLVRQFRPLVVMSSIETPLLGKRLP